MKIVKVCRLNSVKNFNTEISLRCIFLDAKNIQEVEVMVLPDDSSPEIEEIRAWLKQYSVKVHCGAGYDENGTLPALPDAFRMLKR